MVPKQNDLETAKSLILNIFSFLEHDHLYSVTVDVESSKVSIESLRIKYTNAIKRRKITISYSKGKLDDKLVYTFLATITRIPYSDVEDFFDLSTYLDSLGKDFPSNVYNELDEVKGGAVLNQIADALKTYAMKIIEGEQWLGNYYPEW